MLLGLLLLFEEPEGSRTWALPGEIAGLVEFVTVPPRGIVLSRM